MILLDSGKVVWAITLKVSVIGWGVGREDGSRLSVTGQEKVSRSGTEPGFVCIPPVGV